MAFILVVTYKYLEKVHEIEHHILFLKGEWLNALKSFFSFHLTHLISPFCQAQFHGMPDPWAELVMGLFLDCWSVKLGSNLLTVCSPKHPFTNSVLDVHKFLVWLFFRSAYHTQIINFNICWQEFLYCRHHYFYLTLRNDEWLTWINNEKCFTSISQLSV